MPIPRVKFPATSMPISTTTRRFALRSTRVRCVRDWPELPCRQGKHRIRSQSFAKDSLLSIGYLFGPPARQERSFPCRGLGREKRKMLTGGVDPIKPDTWRVEKGCIPGVSGSPAGNGGGWYCNPPSNDQWRPGRQRHWVLD